MRQQNTDQCICIHCIALLNTSVTRDSKYTLLPVLNVSVTWLFFFIPSHYLFNNCVALILYKYVIWRGSDSAQPNFHPSFIKYKHLLKLHQLVKGCIHEEDPACVKWLTCVHVYVQRVNILFSWLRSSSPQAHCLHQATQRKLEEIWRDLWVRIHISEFAFQQQTQCQNDWLETITKQLVWNLNTDRWWTVADRQLPSPPPPNLWLFIFKISTFRLFRHRCIRTRALNPVACLRLVSFTCCKN